MKVSSGVWNKGGVYIGRITHNGVAIERSLHKLFPDRMIDNKTQALHAYEEMRLLVRSGKLAFHEGTGTSTGTVSSFIKWYIADYCTKRQRRPLPMMIFDKAGHCIRGQSEYYLLRVLDEAFGMLSFGAWASSPATIQTFVHDELYGERELEGYTVTHYLARMKHMINHAIDSEAWGVEANIFDKKALKQLFVPGVARLRRVTREEEGLLRSTLASLALPGIPRFSAPIMWARCRFAFTNGVRRGEILHSQLIHYNFKEWTLTLPPDRVKTTKSASPIPIEDPELRAFLTSRRFLGSESYPFGHPDGAPTLKHEFRAEWEGTLSAAFGVARNDLSEHLDLRFHDIRAECCSRLLERGKSLVDVAEVLRDTVDTVDKHYKRLCNLTVARKTLQEALGQERPRDESEGTGRTLPAEFSAISAAKGR